MPKGFTKQEITIAIPIAVVLLGLITWGMWYEFARSRDAASYADTLQWNSAFQWYFRMHGVYPTVEQDGTSLSGACLVDEGLVGITDERCSQSVRVYHASTDSRTQYYPRTGQNTYCNDTQGCARYYLGVSQSTRAISGQNRAIFRQAPRGFHIFGPEGFLADQKTIPGL